MSLQLPLICANLPLAFATIVNSLESFSWTGCHRKFKRPVYTAIHHTVGQRKDGFMPFWRAFVQKGTQQTNPEIELSLLISLLLLLIIMLTMNFVLGILQEIFFFCFFPSKDNFYCFNSSSSHPALIPAFRIWRTYQNFINILV